MKQIARSLIGINFKHPLQHSAISFLAHAYVYAYCIGMLTGNIEYLKRH